MKLWFENDYEEREVIADCNNNQEVIQAIHNFIYKHNKNFKINYIRYWKEDNMIKYDVGSHSEFFYWEGEIEKC